VGTRKYSAYGKQVALDLSSKLAKLGITIVSGLARGIDTFAHKAALEAGGRTIAVLGSGMDQKSFSPSCNYALGEEIAQNGAVITEYLQGTIGAIYTFPEKKQNCQRLSLGVIVIEAPEQGGALITANLALEQNKEVFAIPGNIYDENSQGTHKLIKQEAKLVTCIKDILEELNLSHLLSKTTKTKAKPENKKEEIILSLLSLQPTHIDEIIKLSKLPTSMVNSTLTIFEIKNAIRNLGKNNYIIK